MKSGAVAYSLSFLLHAGVLVWMARSIALMPPMAQLEAGEVMVELSASLPTVESGVETPVVEIEPSPEPPPPEPTAAPLNRETPEVPQPRAKLEPIDVAVANAVPVPQPPASSREQDEHKPLEEVVPPKTPRRGKQDQMVESALSAIATPAVVGSEVETPPSKLPTNRTPPYPLEALLLGQEGRVILRVRIDSSGQVVAVAVETSSSVPSLDQSARATVSGWRFSPARRGNVAVEYEVLVPVNFSIRGR